ncbi:BTAD domain-containing putative transcriptional regulator [Streptomyces tendae]|uniref:AfsR/SARP family transcriptional regulator n=1 Tax=Streptomyces TaxID=1883 RepID=UPI001E5D9FB2|nr:AfsR/SARP family transcriptional regulator [Streptomyces tendae]
MQTIYGGSMYFFTLGPSEIRGSNRIMRPKGAIQQLLFASFMATAGQVVTVESLAEELWGTTPPKKMNNALQAQISRLRRMLAHLEPDSVPRITATVSGYQFRLRSGELDAQVFLDSIEAIRTGVGGDPRRCANDLRRAITLWRGPAFGGVVGGPLCQTAASKYEEARLSALELLYGIELKCGRHARIIPELTETLALNPVQEQFCRLLMLALYRSGRHIDALNTYRQFRHRLNEDLGVDPSPTLRWCESAILEHDPALLGEPALAGQAGVRI